jgi:hypothetical protein
VPYTPGTSGCLFGCNVTGLWRDSCECPNDCSGHGHCSQSGCVCGSSWQGQDCSIPVSFPSCAPGMTSPFCNVPIVPSLAVPFPSLFPNEPVYANDPYGDEHPLFNRSAVSMIQLTLSEADYLYLVNPANAFNQSDKSASLTVANEAISASGVAVRLTIAGYSSRKSIWKNWNVHLGKNNGLGVQDMSEFTLKGGSEDASMMRNLINADVSRALGLAVQRFGFAQVWINGRFHGFFLVEERVNADFLKSRFPGVKKKEVGLVKVVRIGGYLQYKGDNVSAYADHYEVKAGDKDAVLATVANLARLVDLSSNETFVSQVSSVFDLARFVRYMVVETLAGNPDSYTMRGNNYLLYIDANNQSTFIPYDQEESLGIGLCEPDCDRCNSTCWQHLSPTQFFHCPPFVTCRPHPLSLKAFDNMRDLFSALYAKAVSAIFSQLVVPRIEALAQVFEAALEGDPWYDLDMAGIPRFNASQYRATVVNPLIQYVQGRAKQAHI